MEFSYSIILNWGSLMDDQPNDIQDIPLLDLPKMWYFGWPLGFLTPWACRVSKLAATTCIQPFLVPCKVVVCFHLSFLMKIVLAFPLNEDFVLPSLYPNLVHLKEVVFCCLDMVKVVQVYLAATASLHETDFFLYCMSSMLKLNCSWQFPDRFVRLWPRSMFSWAGILPLQLQLILWGLRTNELFVIVSLFLTCARWIHGCVTMTWPCLQMLP